MTINEFPQDPPNPPQQRWYDKEQTVARSVRLIKTFPTDYQEVLGETVIGLAEKHCGVNALLENLRQLGPDKVLNLFKAKSKSRNYDQNATLHKAMNCLYVLPEDQRIFIAIKVIDVVGHFFEYLIICQETRQPSRQDILQDLSHAFIQETLEDTANHLSQFHPSMTLPNGPTLKSIRDRIHQSKSKGYIEEIALFQGSVLNPSGGQNPSPEVINTLQSKPASGTDTPPTTTAPLRESDETVAQDNRGMKIRQDKFGG
ncbi:hypothetical protein [Vampirovibrio sp.]|uniref:hypothetical protein n=1 Tax=Vampirovibrio sp. TaxID=2717857 RepID=UPI003593E2E6